MMRVDMEQEFNSNAEESSIYRCRARKKGNGEHMGAREFGHRVLGVEHKAVVR